MSQYSLSSYEDLLIASSTSKTYPGFLGRFLSFVLKVFMITTNSDIESMTNVQSSIDLSIKLDDFVSLKATKREIAENLSVIDIMLQSIETASPHLAESAIKQSMLRQKNQLLRKLTIINNQEVQPTIEIIDKDSFIKKLNIFLIDRKVISSELIDEGNDIEHYALQRREMRRMVDTMLELGTIVPQEKDIMLQSISDPVISTQYVDLLSAIFNIQITLFDNFHKIDLHKTYCGMEPEPMSLMYDVESSEWTITDDWT